MSLGNINILGKKQSVISVRDGDRLVFHTAKFDDLSVDTMTFKRSSGASTLYQCYTFSLETESVPLFYTRIDYEGVGENRKRIVGYLDSYENPGESSMIPFRGIFDVSVDYNSGLNSLSLNFFCHVLNSFTGDYLEDSDIVESFDNESVDNIKKIFCTSPGFLMHGYVSGGLVGDGVSSEGFSYFPVFMKPRVVSESAVEVIGSTGGGGVPAKITGAPTNGEYPVDIYADGKNETSTGTGMVEVLSLNLSETLPVDTWIIASPAALIETGGA